MSTAAWRIVSTALPSATPGAVSNPIVAAGYCATWVICNGAGRSVMVATADSGVGAPEPVLRFNWPSAAAVLNTPGRASRITRYWLVSVKIVETMRWPKALYSASSTALAVIARREAVSRSTATWADSPCAPASLVTLRTCRAGPSWRRRAISLPVQSVTTVESAPSSETRYWVGPVSASMVRSCVGCR